MCCHVISSFLYVFGNVGNKPGLIPSVPVLTSTLPSYSSAVTGKKHKDKGTSFYWLMVAITSSLSSRCKMLIIFSINRHI